MSADPKKVDHAAEARRWLATSRDPALVHAVLAVAEEIRDLTDELSYLDQGTATRGTQYTGEDVA